MNGYFQLINTESGVDLKLVKATNGDPMVGIQEVTNYLNRQRLPFDLKTLHQAIISKDPESIVHLMDKAHYPIAENALVSVSVDRMSAEIRFYAPSNDGNPMRKEDIYSELRTAKVVFGIDDAMVDQLFQNREYCKTYVIAKGQEVQEGSDASIAYYFETDNRIRPTLREDGSVDFFNLNVVNHCKAGDLLAKLTPEDKGVDGKDVLGNVLKPKEVKRLKLSYGLNIELSEDQLELHSKVNGHVSLVDGKVFVADILEVNNVDNSTGNLNYEGNVVIQGNVCANFTVKANGNVEVRGVVEGARIEATGNIILSRGMNGMSKGVLQAGGNVVAKYLENCTVYAGGYVETECILHSYVHAKTDINVVSRKGFITGGSVSATNRIRVKTLGNSMGSDVEVSVGVDPMTTSRMSELEQQINVAQKNLKVMLPVIDASKKKIAQGVKLGPEQLKTLQQLLVSAKQLQDEIQASNDEIEMLKSQVEEASDARVEITGEVFPGTKINISGASMLVKNSMKYCAFQLKDEVIQFCSL